MVFFYTTYPYSPKATALSILGNLLGLFLAVLAIAMIGNYEEGAAFIIGGIAFAAFAAFCYFFIGRKLAKKVAETDGMKNIKTKSKYAYKYCMQHPEQFYEIASVNTAFAAKYTKDASGKIVKIK